VIIDFIDNCNLDYWWGHSKILCLPNFISTNEYIDILWYQAMFVNIKMASGDSATSVRILNENVDKLTNLPDMVKAFDELTNEEVIGWLYSAVFNFAAQMHLYSI